MAKFQFFFFGGGGGIYCQQVKTEKSSSAKICLNFNLGGGGSVLRVGHSQNFEPNFQPLQLAHASQIVSHILRMWRLMIQAHRGLKTVLAMTSVIMLQYIIRLMFRILTLCPTC